ncbi:hypothetical protein E2P81_ATG01672 [Venturia nashicola]|uniref:Uncharacterized protein n=1 Tax=Venturia nashicola TaxID=86259 RepID=A0A4Z1NE33_9PEZI|nr:hypothetical protein E6O75_ATG01715 [Venturia nashicola]TLD18944.1 hypothetical protein E2P81_ATG01672 [Venturia nashicola]
MAIHKTFRFNKITWAKDELLNSGQAAEHFMETPFLWSAGAICLDLCQNCARHCMEKLEHSSKMTWAVET